MDIENALGKYGRIAGAKWAKGTVNVGRFSSRLFPSSLMSSFENSVVSISVLSVLSYRIAVLQRSNLFIIEDPGAFHVGCDIYLGNIADNRDHCQEEPENKGEVQQEELALIAVGQALGFPQASLPPIATASRSM